MVGATVKLWRRQLGKEARPCNCEGVVERCQEKAKTTE